MRARARAATSALPAFAAQVEFTGVVWRLIYNAHRLKLADVASVGDHHHPLDRLISAQSMNEPLILLTTDGPRVRYGSTVGVI